MADSEVLPLPEAVIRHHGKTIHRPMSEWVTQGRVPPVLLITGPAGVGKREIATYLSQWILCERSGFAKAQDDAGETSLFGGGLFGTPEAAPPEPEKTPEKTGKKDSPPAPCGQCGSCQRALHNNWVDFAEVLPDADSGTLKVDQFRKLKGSLGFGAHESAFKITLIPHADRMTPQAANSLLKLLEEPPPGWVFFLTASDPTLILPTVLSRCQTLRLKPMDADTLEELLAGEGLERDRLRVLVELAQGSWRKAVSLSKGELWDRRALIFSFLREPGAHLNGIVDWATQEAKGSEAPPFEAVLDQFEHVLIDLIRWSINPAPPEGYNWTNADGRQALAIHAAAVLKTLGSRPQALAFWTERAERLAMIRRESLAPLNRKLLIQDLLLPWLGVRPR